MYFLKYYRIKFLQNSKNSTGFLANANMKCSDHFKYPNSCAIDKDECDYEASWSVDTTLHTVTFRVTTRAAKWAPFWSAIGFSPTGAMTGADVVMGYKGSVSNVGTVVDMFVDHEKHLTRDVKQNIADASYKEVTATATNATSVHVRFSRTLDNRDPDQDIPLEKCVYFLYPVWPGNITDGIPMNHEKTPIVSNIQMCWPMCSKCSQLNNSAIIILVFYLAACFSTLNV